MCPAITGVWGGEVTLYVYSNGEYRFCVSTTGVSTTLHRRRRDHGTPPPFLPGFFFLFLLLYLSRDDTDDRFRGRCKTDPCTQEYDGFRCSARIRPSRGGIQNYNCRYGTHGARLGKINIAFRRQIIIISSLVTCIYSTHRINNTIIIMRKLRKLNAVIITEKKKTNVQFIILIIKYI